MFCWTKAKTCASCEDRLIGTLPATIYLVSTLLISIVCVNVSLTVPLRASDFAKLCLLNPNRGLIWLLLLSRVSIESWWKGRQGKCDVGLFPYYEY